MTTQQFLTSAWTWNTTALALSGVALIAYVWAFGLNRRILYLLAGLGVFVLTLVSPFSALANGYLFSAHMVQHILLVLIVPALLLLSLPRSFSLRPPLTYLSHPLIGWVAGVGAMWLWHAPTLCNAAATSRIVSAIQTTSLLIMGSVFWWQVLAPREEQRLSPPAGIVYLFTACTACSVLGIILTFAPVSICPVYQHPVDRLGMLSTIRGDWGLTSGRDQQIGGLLMWVPMCAIYVTAILAQLARWHSYPAPHTEEIKCLTNNQPQPFGNGAARLAGTTRRATAAPNLFPGRAGHGGRLSLLGIDHHLGCFASRRCPLRGSACRLDHRNSPWIQISLSRRLRH